MDEKALNTLYELAKGEGYTKDYDSFKTLMNSNQDAVNSMYKIAQNEGYTKSQEKFSTLVGYDTETDVLVEEEVVEEGVVEEEVVEEEIDTKPWWDVRKDDTDGTNQMYGIDLEGMYVDISEKKITKDDGPYKGMEMRKGIPRTKDAVEGELYEDVVNGVVYLFHEGKYISGEQEIKAILKKEAEDDVPWWKVNESKKIKLSEQQRKEQKAEAFNLENYGDISFENFDGVEEDDMVDIINKKYQYLEAYKATAGGIARDKIIVKNKETDEEIDLLLNTEYNRNKGVSINPKLTYNKFLEFANLSRYDKKGRIKKNRPMEEVVLDDGSTMNVPLQITKQALKLIREDKTGTLTMEDAINQAKEASWGDMHIKWQASLANKKVADDIAKVLEIKEIIKDKDFDVDIRGDTGSDMSQNTIDILLDLGMPRDIIKTEMDQQWLEASVEIDPLDPSPDKEFLFNRIDRHREATIKDQIRTWLGNPENELGSLIIKASTDYNTEKIKQTQAFKKQNEIIEKLDKAGVEYTDADVQYLANTELEADLEKHSEDTFREDFSGLMLMTPGDKDKVLELKRKIASQTSQRDKNIGEDVRSLMEGGMGAEKAYEKAKKDNPITDEHTQLLVEQRELNQKLLDDDKVKLLRNEDGTFRDPQKQNQADERKISEIKNKINEYKFMPTDELNKILNNYNTELIYIAKQLNKKGYSETMGEASVAQQIGEPIAAFGDWLANFTGGGLIIGDDNQLVDVAGSAYSDFKDFKHIAETGELPTVLTTIPTGNDRLTKRWNELLQDRNTLLFAKTLNVDPTTFEYSGFWGAIGEAIPGAVGAEGLGKSEMRRRFYDTLERDMGFKLTDQQKFDALEHHDSWERTGASIPGFTRMGLEMMGTFALTGGTGNLANFYSTVTRNTMALAVKKGLPLVVAKPLAKFSTGVAVEYTGLMGSNFISEKVFRQEGIKNPLLFAMGSRFGHWGLGKASNAYTKAIRKYAKKNERFATAVTYLDKMPGTRLTQSGLKFMAAPAVGTVGIKAGETISGLKDVAFGEKTMSELWHEITDVNSLMETYGALVFMKGARPDVYTKQAFETFRAEGDVLRGMHPMYNQARIRLGLKPLKTKGNNTDAEIDAAIENKLYEVEQDKKLTQKQKLQKKKQIHLDANRLKLKRGLDIIAEEYIIGKPGEEELHDKLKLTIKSLQAGNKLDAHDLLILAESGFANEGMSPVTELQAMGLSEVEATNLYKQAVNITTEARFNFGQDVTKKGYKEYIAESLKENRLIRSKQDLKTKLDRKTISESFYELEKKKIDNELDIITKRKMFLSEMEAKTREAAGIKTTKKLKEEGFEVIEGTPVEMAKLEKELGGEFSEHALGKMGIDTREFLPDGSKNPNYEKGIILVNVEARKAGKRGAGTVVHEAWHFPGEAKLSPEAIDKRSEELMKDKGLDKEKAVEQAEKEATDFVEDFKQGLKDKGLYEMVLEEMNMRPTEHVNPETGEVLSYGEAKAEGLKIPFELEREWINEFIELETEGRFKFKQGTKELKTLAK